MAALLGPVGTCVLVACFGREFRIWFQGITGWSGKIRVDGQPYVWMGADRIPVNESTVSNVQITPTRAIYVMQAGPVNFTVTFLSPIEVSTLLLFELKLPSPGHVCLWICQLCVFGGEKESINSERKLALARRLGQANYTIHVCVGRGELSRRQRALRSSLLRHQRRLVQRIRSLARS